MTLDCCQRSCPKWHPFQIKLRSNCSSKEWALSFSIAIVKFGCFGAMAEGVFLWSPPSDQSDSKDSGCTQNMQRTKRRSQLGHWKQSKPHRASVRRQIVANMQRKKTCSSNPIEAKEEPCWLESDLADSRRKIRLFLDFEFGFLILFWVWWIRLCTEMMLLPLWMVSQ